MLLEINGKYMLPEESWFYKAYNEHKGEFVINGEGKVVQLYALADDGEDYYFVFSHFGDIEYHSCVMSFTVLKDKIDIKDYERFVYYDSINRLSYNKLNEKEFTIVDTIDCIDNI